MEINDLKPEADKRNKGGRPPKRIRRSNDMRVRLTDIERILIEGKAKEAGMRPSEWFRQAAKRATVVSRLTPDDLSILRMLAGMANNLNQITKLAHQESLLTVQKRCREILAEIDTTLKYLNSDDRKSNDR
ncbi:MobC family plasmid mobilization relaxosome protein [Hufsiella ginkgonis]|uniref:Plasmid mobilization relaxosome protein MobC n=1 Tax=Hufsiella ginkgonis TaxID=2695274 RepID=A0A7K1Y0D6_9SPHI|nr:MobC family plasmid mobilization relaxosome protein [Hufsiella ginkgonis]MXV16538.1 plasmid mobilization relaxosome protein MobC [Hufsiella ginkgonis]